MTENEQPDPLTFEDAPRRRFSLIWAVPLIAIVVALGVAYQNWSQQGPVIEVSFGEASGLTPGKTELRYRDISVGQVEDLRFSDSLDRVIASIRLDKALAPFVDADAQFWIVRPEVTSQGVSGLDTVLSGVYISGNWDDQIGNSRRVFEGLPAAPIIPLGETGSIFSLQSEMELPPAGTPILYKGVAVGTLGPSELDPGGATASAQAVIFAPHDQLVTSATRFWDVSGVDFSLGVGGAQLDFDSLASLIAGGVTFETLASGGAPLSEGAVYTLYPDEDEAREDFSIEGPGGSVDVIAVFEENLPGLQTGAAVTLGGLRLGQVQALSGIVDPDLFGDNQARLQTTLRLNPGRLGLDATDEETGLLAFLETRIAEGLRARLATASIITGGLKVELVDVPNAAPAILVTDADTLPRVPTAPADVNDVAGSAQNVLSRINALPVEAVLEETLGLIGDLRGVVGNEDIQAAPASLLATLNAIQQVATSDAVAELPTQLSEATTGLTETAGELTALLQDVEEEAVVAALSELISELNATAQTLPQLSQEARAVFEQVQALPLTPLTEQATDTLADIEALAANEDLAGAIAAIRNLFGNPDLEALPGDLRQSVASLQARLNDEALVALPSDIGSATTEIRQSLARIDAMLAQAQRENIVGNASQTVDALKTTAEALPAITDQAGRVLSQAEALALDDLFNDLSDAVAALARVIDQDSTRTLPAELNTTLAELRTTLAELRAGGIVENANAALAAARDAAEAISQASATLPALSDRLSQAAAQASATLNDFDRDSVFARDLSAVIAQIDAAAASVERLARQIARNPNSLLTGR